MQNLKKITQVCLKDRDRVDEKNKHMWDVWGAKRASDVFQESSIEVLTSWLPLCVCHDFLIRSENGYIGLTLVSSFLKHKC